MFSVHFGIDVHNQRRSSAVGKPCCCSFFGFLTHKFGKDDTINSPILVGNDIPEGKNECLVLALVVKASIIS